MEGGKEKNKTYITTIMIKEKNEDKKKRNIIYITTIIRFIFIYIISFHMAKKVVNPKVLIHLTIAPDLKQFLIENNINASELLEKAIMELIEISKNEQREDIMEYYEDIKKRLESQNILVIPYQFEDKAYFREQQIKAMDILRHKLGFNYEDAKKILERYTREKEEEVLQNSENYKDLIEDRS